MSDITTMAPSTTQIRPGLFIAIDPHIEPNSVICRTNNFDTTAQIDRPPPPPSTQQSRTSQQALTSAITTSYSSIANYCKHSLSDSPSLSPACSSFRFSLFFTHVNIDSQHIESFVSSSISTKSRFLSQFKHWTELHPFSNDQYPMDNQELFHLCLSQFIPIGFHDHQHHIQWILHSIPNTSFRSLWVDINGDYEYLVTSNIIKISLCPHHSLWYHG